MTDRSPNRLLAVIVVASAFVVQILDVTIVNVAAPSIQTGLNASATQLQWILAGYAFAFSVLLITGGRLGDISGYRRMFMIGMSAFTAASILCGLAWDANSLVVARLAQGAAAAMMAPQILSTVQILYPPNERIRVMAVFGLLGGAASVLGPILGGALLEANLWGSGWRPIFLINAPIGIVSLVLAWRLLPSDKPTPGASLDLGGSAIVFVALGLLIYPLIEGRAHGWPWWSFAMMAASIPAGLLFTRHVLRIWRSGGYPLVAPELFQVRSYLSGLSIIAVFQMATAGLFLASSITLQTGLAFSPLATSLMHAPFALGTALSIGVLGRSLLPRLGRNMVLIGALVMIFGLVAFAWTLRLSQSPLVLATMAATFAVAGLGMGLVAAPMTTLTLAEVNTRHAGSASGVYNAVQQLGAALGVAILGLIFFSVSAAGSRVDFVNAFAAVVAAQVAILALVGALTRLLPRPTLPVGTAPVALAE